MYDCICEFTQRVGSNWRLIGPIWRLYIICMEGQKLLVGPPLFLVIILMMKIINEIGLLSETSTTVGMLL